MNAHWEGVIYAVCLTVVTLFGMHSCTSCAKNDLAAVKAALEAAK